MRPSSRPSDANGDPAETVKATDGPFTGSSRRQQLPCEHPDATHTVAVCWLGASHPKPVDNRHTPAGRPGEGVAGPSSALHIAVSYKDYPLRDRCVTVA